jgi:hypothetical protein
MARDSCVGSCFPGDVQVEALVGVTSKPAYFAPGGRRTLLTHCVAVKKVLTQSCQLAKQRSCMRFARGYLRIQDRLGLVNSSSQCSPVGVADFQRVGAALRGCARNNVEVFERCDDGRWWRDANFAAVWLRVRHQHTLDRSVRDTTASSQLVLDEVRQSTVCHDDHGFEDITLLTRTDSSKTSRRTPLLCQDAEFLGRSAEQIEQGA